MRRRARRTGSSPAGEDYPGAVRPRRQVRNASLVACVLALVVVALGAATGSAAPSQATSVAPASRACAPKVGTAGPFVGVNAPDAVLGNARFRACAFNALVKAHVGLVRDVF